MASAGTAAAPRREALTPGKSGRDEEAHGAHQGAVSAEGAIQQYESKLCEPLMEKANPSANQQKCRSEDQMRGNREDASLK
ncbi:hypothetical protein SKAU_G00291450 [Synaphobranchus kaupii]|uniref:Uncharacterized protein n=1 Tax=Synaphobranchus kaupii TaxID=118154 RepID=A0A9Q1ILE4_SYNKA|nr:hypothetical protein SKAU_G00291450 [Synaphobranchus kaupii]